MSIKVPDNQVLSQINPLMGGETDPSHFINFPGLTGYSRGMVGDGGNNVCLIGHDERVVSSRSNTKDDLLLHDGFARPKKVNMSGSGLEAADHPLPVSQWITWEMHIGKNGDEPVKVSFLRGTRIVVEIDNVVMEGQEFNQVLRKAIDAWKKERAIPSHVEEVRHAVAVLPKSKDGSNKRDGEGDNPLINLH